MAANVFRRLQRLIVLRRIACVDDLSADLTRCLQIWIEAAAQGAQRVEARGHGNAIELHGELGRRVKAEFFASKSHAAVAERRVASQILKAAACVVVNETAVGIEVEGCEGQQIRRAARPRRGAALPLVPHRRFRRHATSPVKSPRQPGSEPVRRRASWPKLRLAPIEIEMQRHLTQRGARVERWPPCAPRPCLPDTN